MKKSKILRVIAMVMAVSVCAAFMAACNKDKGNNGLTGNENDPSSNIVRAVGRESGSGTRTAFLELVTNNEGKSLDEALEEGATLSTVVSEANGTSAVITAVAQRYDTVGYISLGSLSEHADEVKALTVNGVVANEANILAGSYKLARPFVLAYQQSVYDGNDLVRNLIQFIESSEGQAIIAQEGYICDPDLEIQTYVPYAGSETSLTINGSTSVGPLMKVLVEAFISKNTGKLTASSITISETGSGDGIAAATDGTAQIGMSSRALKDEEKTVLKEHKIADDGIAVIVKAGSTMENVTFDQLYTLYLNGTGIENPNKAAA